jgi:DHA1 family tetracycline resistance protein-like MFS transporter
MLGSAVGYLIFGIGGALWVLFAGRIIDGITGGNLTVAFAYIADVTPPDERGKFFGWIGALSGIGFIIGPTLGGLLARFGNEVPLYFAAALTFANLIFGFFFMPESLPPEKRATSITVKGLNPFGVLRQVVAVPQLRRLLLALFLFNLPFSVLQTNIGLFVHDNLSWDIAMTGSLFALVGITDILVQGILLQRLLKSFGEARVATFGLVGELAGYLLITSVAFTKAPALMVIGTFTLAMGDGLLGPSVAGLLSRSADEQSQGQVQGGSQAVQALAHIGGPVLGGAVYDRHGYASPYLAGAGLVMVALGVIMSASREKRRNLKTVGL